MRTHVIITDAGTSSHVIWESTALTVTDSGGCPVEELLGKIDMSNDDLVKLANEILAAWSAGYDGDPTESELRVELKRGFRTATARA